jgi:Rrf2 family protein
MHIPIKVDYSVRALIDLATHQDEGTVRAADIAERQHIPVAFLDRLMGSLSKDGLVRSYRGPQGGHALGKDASEISLGMVMMSAGALETVIGCLEDPDMCFHVPICSQREIWREVDEAVQRILDATSIADLVQRMEPVETS